jgi:hypothetical protein
MTASVLSNLSVTCATLIRELEAMKHSRKNTQLHAALRPPTERIFVKCFRVLLQFVDQMQVLLNSDKKDTLREDLYTFMADNS